MIFGEYHIYNTITGITSKLFIPDGTLFQRDLLMYCDVINRYGSTEPERGVNVKNRFGMVGHIKPSMYDFQCDENTYTYLEGGTYPEHMIKSLRSLAPQLERNGYASFARIDFRGLSPELYVTFISSFWKKLL